MRNPGKNKLFIFLLFVVLSKPVLGHHEEIATTSSFVLDVIQIMIGFVTVYFAWTVLGGKIGKGLKFISVGLAIFGLFHLLETLLFLTTVSITFNEIIHRLLGIVAFLFVLGGVYIINRAIKAK